MPQFEDNPNQVPDRQQGREMFAFHTLHLLFVCFFNFVVLSLRLFLPFRSSAAPADAREP